MQVSLPGFDVATATLDQMAFDARFANMAVILKGSIGLSVNSWATVPFSTGYATVPRALVGFRLNSGPTKASMPAARLTNHGSYQNWQAVLVTNSYAQIGSFINSGDPAELNLGNGTAYYMFFK